ncbi:MAG: hypothetical protein ACHQQ3_12750, partial [Gemmatimonadales bacterium]
MPHSSVRLRSLGLACLIAARLMAQSGYRNTDAGRPLRIEDATPIERFGIELQFPSFRLERFQPNVQRSQLEPRLSFGILPRTELEMRAPIVYREGNSVAKSGLAGLGVGMTRNFNDETPSLPAFAANAEVVLPAGAAATSPATIAVRALMTRTTSFARLHVNAAYGTYNLVSYPPIAGNPTCTTNCGGVIFVPINDGPCEVEPADAGTLMPPAHWLYSPIQRQTVPTLPDLTQFATVRQGRRLLVGVAGDHTFPLASTMIAADLYVERFSLSTQPADWSAEFGARHQLGPQVVVDAAVGRRFTGASQSWYFSLGSSFTVAT